MSRPRTTSIEYVRPSDHRIFETNSRVFYDTALAAWVARCWTCQRYFKTKRRHAITCSPACRQERSRRIRD